MEIRGIGIIDIKAMYGVGALLSSSKLKAKMGSAMTDGMLMPYKKLLEGEK